MDAEPEHDSTVLYLLYIHLITIGAVQTRRLDKVTLQDAHFNAHYSTAGTESLTASSTTSARGVAGNASRKADTRASESEE